MERMGERRNAYRILVGEPEDNGAFMEDIGIDGGIILKWKACAGLVLFSVWTSRGLL